MKSITCSTCKQDKPIKEFYRCRSKTRGRHYRCIECEKLAKNLKSGDVDGRSLRTIRNKPNRRDGEVLCGTCKVWKKEDQFYNHAKYGKGTRCKPCDKEARKQHYETNFDSDKARWRRTKHIHGLTKEQWETILNKQEGVCAICKMTQNERGYDSKNCRYLSVDHNHKSGKVRGLLCNGCNRGLGFFLDSPGLLREAANYLDSH